MNNRISVLTLLRELRQSPVDLRLEVILAELLDVGYVFDNFLVRPIGLHARRYRRDLGEVSEEKFARGIRTVLKSHREGLYDALPKHLFHQVGAPDPDGLSGTAAIVAEIRRQRAKEQATRRFFLPYEQEFYRFRVEIEKEERKYFTNLEAGRYSHLLARFWGIADAKLPIGPLTNLLYLLPLAHNIVGDLSRTQQCFESVLWHPVELRVVAPQRHSIHDKAAGISRHGLLGAITLGRDSVLDGEHRETLLALEIRLRPASVSELEAYFVDDWPARALELLCRHFVAFETDCVIKYELAKAPTAFHLHDGADAALLGYTTVGI